MEDTQSTAWAIDRGLEIMRIQGRTEFTAEDVIKASSPFLDHMTAVVKEDRMKELRDVESQLQARESDLSEWEKDLSNREVALNKVAANA